MMPVPFLETLCRQVQNTFDAERIALAEQLIALAYAGKVLRKDTMQKLLRTIAAEKENLEDDVIIKDLLQRRGIPWPTGRRPVISNM